MKKSRLVRVEQLESERARARNDEQCSLWGSIDLGIELATEYFESNEFDSCSRVLQDIEREISELPVPDHQALFFVKDTMALISYRRGELDAACHLEREALSAAELANGPDGENSQRARFSLIRMLWELDSREELVSLQQEAYKSAVRQVGAYDRHTLDLLYQIACTRRKMGDIETCLGIDQYLVERFREILGVSSHEALTVGSNLALDLAVLGRFDEAKAAIDRVANDASGLGWTDSLRWKIKKNQAAIVGGQWNSWRALDEGIAWPNSGKRQRD